MSPAEFMRPKQAMVWPSEWSPLHRNNSASQACREKRPLPRAHSSVFSGPFGESSAPWDQAGHSLPTVLQSASLAGQGHHQLRLEIMVLLWYGWWIFCGGAGTAAALAGRGQGTAALASVRLLLYCAGGRTLLLWCAG